MTATEQLIAKPVSDVCPASVDDLPLQDAARRGLIAPLRCLRVPPVAAINSVPVAAGGFSPALLAKTLDTQALNQAAASLYRDRFDNPPGIVYAAGVDHAYNLAQEFRAAGLKAEAVSGRTPPVRLAETLAAYERGEINVLINAMLLAEGWNSPRATVCMHLAPTASRRVYQQRIGRIMRTHPRKVTDPRPRKACLEQFLTACAAENPNRRLRMTALSDRVSMTVERADFDDLVTLVTQAPTWEKDRLQGVRILLRALAEGKADAPDQILERWTWKLARATRKAQDRRVSAEFPEAKRLLGALANSRGHRHEENAAKLVNAAVELPIGVGVALLAPADGYPPRATKLIEGARGKIGTLAEVAYALAENLPPPKAHTGRRRRRRRKKRGGAQQQGAAGAGQDGAGPRRRRRRRKPTEPGGSEPSPTAEAPVTPA